MSLEQVTRSWNVAKVIRALEQATQARTILRYANEILGNWGDCIFVPNCRTVQRAAILYGGTSPVTFISAGVSAATTQAFLGGWSNATQSRIVGGWNTVSANDVFERIIPFWRVFARGRTPTQYFGHSAGGVLAECLRYFSIVNGIGDSKEKITYGAPKGAFLNSYQEPKEATSLRWVLDGDPVPCLPFYGVGGGYLGLLVLLNEDYQPDLYAHPYGGRFLRDNGTFAEAGTGTGSNIPNGGDVIGWMTGLGDIQANSHRIRTYVYALEAAKDRLESEPPPGPIEVVPTVPAFGRRIPVVAIGGPGLVREFDIGRIDGGVLSVPTRNTSFRINEGIAMANNGKIDKRLQATATRGNGAYYVFWMETQVCQCGSLGKARTVARGINYMLRRLGKTSSVQVSGWEQAVSAFFSAATTAGFGYKPPLVTG